MSESFISYYYRQQALAIAEPWAVRYVDAAFAGDADAALDLVSRLGNRNRGIVAVMMWRSKVPRKAFRVFLAAVWDHDFQHLISEAGPHLVRMFRYAAFTLPADFPQIVTVWRGTSAVSIDVARKGRSWTTDRDIACFFAMRLAGADRAPLLLAAEIKSGDIALFHGGRGESEAVLLKPPTNVVVDGDAHDWAAGFERFRAVIRAHSEKALLKHKRVARHED